MKQYFLICLLVCTSWMPASASERSSETIAGTGLAENNSDHGPASTTNIGEPFGVEVGPDEAIYITEVRHHRIRRLDPKTHELTTVAGNGKRGYSGDGGPALQAELNEPYEVRFDSSGNMYFVEMKNHIVRRVDHQTGVISTVAGTGRQGYSGDGGPATKAMLNQPHSIAPDREGAIYIADIGNHRIRRVDPKTGVIDSIAGNGKRSNPQDNQTARGHSLVGPRALFIHGDILWIALREGHSVWRMNLADGILHHIAGTGQPGYSGDNGPAINAKFNGPKGIAVGPNGQIVVCDSANNAIRQIDPKSGLISTITGGESQNVKSNAKLNQPHGVCVTPDGAILIGDTLNHRVLRINK